MKNITSITQQMDALERFDENLKMRREVLDTHKNEFDQRLKQRVDQMYGSTDDIESTKQQILSLASPFPSPSLQARYPYLRKAAQEVMKENPAYKPGDYYADIQMKKLVATADIVALRGALTKVTGQQAAMRSYEENGKNTGNALLQLVDKVDQTGMPVFERWLRGGRMATGDPDVAAFDAALTAYTNEVAKILNNPNLTGTLTVSAQQEVKAWAPQSISAAQIKRVVPLLNWEMDYRSRTVANQVDYLDNSIKEIAAGHARPQYQPTPFAPPPIAPSSDDLSGLHIEGE
jgi:hypothetical protein